MLDSAKTFAEWLRRQDYRVIRTKSSWWYQPNKYVWQAFPYHWIIEPEEDELMGLLKDTKSFGLRYSTSLKSKYGKLSYHAVYDSPDYGLSTLTHNNRHNVNRGLKRSQVKKTTFEELSGPGYALQIRTLRRQGRKLNVEKTKWEIMCLAAGELEGFEAWGAFVEGELAASVITFQMNDCSYMLYQQCDERYLHKYVNNALSFTVTKELVSRPNIKSILYGLHSLDAPSDIDEFKFRMGYRPRPVKQRVVFHPVISPLINNTTHTSLKIMTKLFPGQPFYAKLEGFVRFGLESRLPFENQELPAAFERSGMTKEDIEKAIS